MTILEGIWGLMRGNTIIITHVLREGNKSADYLANVAQEIEVVIVNNFQELEPQGRRIVNNDKMCTPYLRIRSCKQWKEDRSRRIETTFKFKFRGRRIVSIRVLLIGCSVLQVQHTQDRQITTRMNTKLRYKTDTIWLLKDTHNKHGKTEKKAQTRICNKGRASE